MEERTVNNAVKANKGFGLGKILIIGGIATAVAGAIVGITKAVKGSKQEAELLEESYDEDVTDVDYEDVETEE